MKYFAYCRKSSEGEDRQALSIPAQIDEINRTLADRPEIEIVAWLEEKMSAKAPGRPVYQSMIQRIEAGEADGIVSWHPDRLARNSVDGGWIIHLLDRNVLKDMKFVSYTFEKSPQGMFMLQIMFGQSKYYVDALSVNVKRGMRKKVEMGWWANLAPLGYLNELATHTIVTDAVRFPLMRRMWDLFLTGNYTVPQIREIANNEWGFRTPIRKNSGGKTLARSAAYRIFSSPFYAGLIVWQGEWRPGKHQPMVTKEEFQRAQKLLERPENIKSVIHDFAYTGLIRCACGLAITAEEKRKPSGRRYVYYHCTRRGSVRCNQPAVRAEVIDAAITQRLQALMLTDDTERFVLECIGDNEPESIALDEAMRASRTAALANARAELEALTGMRLRDLLDDQEFMQRKNKLQHMTTELERVQSEDERISALTLELGQTVVLFRKYAAKWFLEGTSLDKRYVLQTLGSNPVLRDRKLSICASVFFERDPDPAYRPMRLASRDAIGTLAEIERARSIIAYIDALKNRADARRVGALMPPLPASIREKRGAPQGRLAWRPVELREAA
jgi:DNA invertase Pin-like site-specific DNA recombinase